MIIRLLKFALRTVAFVAFGALCAFAGVTWALSGAPIEELPDVVQDAVMSLVDEARERVCSCEEPP